MRGSRWVGILVALLGASEARSQSSPEDARPCTVEATEAAPLQERDQILAACSALIAKLKRSSAQVILSMPSLVPGGARITVSGHVVPESLYGAPYLTSPGLIHVDARAPNFAPYHREFTVAAGEQVTVRVLWTPAPEPVASELDRPNLRFDGETRTSLTVSDSIDLADLASEKSTLRRVGPYAVLGLGAAGLASSVVFLVLRNNAIGSLEAKCNGPGHSLCPDTAEVRSLRESASTNNTLTNISLGLGAAAVTGGALWLFFERGGNQEASRRPAQVQVMPRRGGAVVGVAGAF